MQFLTSRSELRSHYKAVHDRAQRKELRGLDGHSKGFIGKSPFVLIGSSDGNGNADVTPKGDRPGFVAVLDDTTLAIPDRPGNNRLDTWENVIANPAVGLLFLIPGMDETLRINGEARITIDTGLRERLATEGKLPATVMIVAIKAVYMHCAKAFMRSQLWHPATWPSRASLPTLGQILKDQLALTDSAEATDRDLAEAYAKTMW
jgi:PPOX class probable FMN-dependent enzyme